MSRTDIYKDIISFFGANNQKVIAIEELSELQKELCKQFRGNMNQEDLIEEIADCSIMLDQLKIMYNCARKVEEIKEQKIQRTLERYMPQCKKKHKPILSERKKEILRLSCLNNDRIAELLSVESATINTHLLQIYKLLNVASRAGAIIEAIRLNEISIDEVITK